ncbi:methyltransferase [Dermacoccus sp. PE3]|uniref:N-6 DNA methylase n=1 Tax=Dermacoccus sp. PE3 TaxID=1641401 RepID=UPI00064221D8|nr:N-6 DNA methylase [Dermacoccus sp. PE3]KLO61801.1 methyltransferase [Dermacoccus sp. PE3]
MSYAARDPLDTAERRKARGAFFTPALIASFIAQWAIRDASDRVLEPSSGDAEFLVHAVRTLHGLGHERPQVWGAELHEWSASYGAQRVDEAGGIAHVEVGDFFTQRPGELFDVVIGNPPYIRFQDFAGEQRARARAAALQGGVALSGLASAWAAFTIHSAMHLAQGGRLGFVLPAELLSANYAAPVRRFLFERFASVELVLFEQRVFAEAETEAVLLLADGYQQGSSTSASIRQVTNADGLQQLPPALVWSPANPEHKWSGATVATEATTTLLDAVAQGHFTPLTTWGHTRLGMVTGRNTYFAIPPAQAADLGLARRETLPLSPPGSRHLRGLELTPQALIALGHEGKRTRLFRPGDTHVSAQAQAYIEAGRTLGVHEAYKCRTRRTWWQVPLMPPADLLLTYMNADTVRMVTNTAAAHHLNSVHGVYLHEEHRALGRKLLPLAALNSLTMLSAELTGRAYGGGILKMEPGEATRWLVPSPSLLGSAREGLTSVRPHVAACLRRGRLSDAARLVDGVLFTQPIHIDAERVDHLRQAREELVGRRQARA